MPMKMNNARKENNYRGIWLQNYRLSHNFSLGTMAKKLHTTKTSIFNYEACLTSIDDDNFNFITNTLEPSFNYDSNYYQSTYESVLQLIHNYLLKDVNEYKKLAIKIVYDDKLKNSNAFILWLLINYFWAYINLDDNAIYFKSLLSNANISDSILASFYYVININYCFSKNNYLLEEDLHLFGLCVDKFNTNTDVEKGLKAYYLYNKGQLCNSLFDKQQYLDQASNLFLSSFYDRRYLNCLLKKGYIYCKYMRLREAKNVYELSYRFASKINYASGLNSSLYNLVTVQFYLGEYKWCIEHLKMNDVFSGQVTVLNAIIHLASCQENQAKMLLSNLNTFELGDYEKILYEFVVELINGEELSSLNKGFNYVSDHADCVVDWCMTLIRLFGVKNMRECANKAKVFLFDYIINNIA